MTDNQEIFETMGVEFKSDLQRIESLIKEQELDQIHSTIFERITILLISALGLVAALAWDEALKEAFVKYVATLDTLEGKLLYALIITVVAVLVSIVLGKLFIKKKAK